MGDSIRQFSTSAQGYAQYRPSYPPSLFDWLATQCNGNRLALDIAAGSGQASLPLSPYFENVAACDASPEQLLGNDDWQGVLRFASQAQALALQTDSADLVVVAQALHWFATPAFFEEVRRVLRPDGFFCAWCYSLITIDPEIDKLVQHLHSEVLKGYWPKGRASVDAGYSDIRLPFRQVESPTFAIEARWDLARLLGYLDTWSAVTQWKQIHGSDPLELLESRLTQLWGSPDTRRLVRWPLHMLAGYPNRPEAP